MNWQNLVSAFFGEAHTVVRTGDLLSGSGTVGGQTVAVVGTTDHAPIGVELALAQARCVADCMGTRTGNCFHRDSSEMGCTELSNGK